MIRVPGRKLLLALAILCVFAHAALAKPLEKAALIGKWDFTSYAILQDGVAGEPLPFKPGAISFTYRPDGTWLMQAGDEDHTQLNGAYEIHGSELIMKKSDGSLYQDFQVEMKDDGSAMTMKDKRSIVTASKVESTP